MAKYGTFQYGESVYGKTVAAGEAVLSPTGVLSVSLVFLVAVGQGVVAPVGVFVRRVWASVTAGQGVVAPEGAVKRAVARLLSVGGAGTVRSLYGAFKYGTSKYNTDLQSPSGDFSRQLQLYRDVGVGQVTSVGKLVKSMFVVVGEGIATSVGLLVTVFYPWLRSDLFGFLQKRKDLKGTLHKEYGLEGEVVQEDDFTGGVKK